MRKASDDGGNPACIVNISSVAGQLALPFLGPYAASKHGVEGLSDSLRRECRLYGIHVVVIDPAGVATPIWNKADEIDLSVYSGSPYRARRPRARYTIGKGSAQIWMLRHFLSTRMIDWLIARNLGLMGGG